MLLERARAIWLRAMALVRRRRLDRDLDEELAFHLASRAQKYGDDPARTRRRDASSETRRRFARRAASYGHLPPWRYSCRTCAMQHERWRRRRRLVWWRSFRSLWASEPIPRYSV